MPAPPSGACSVLHGGGQTCRPADGQPAGGRCRPAAYALGTASVSTAPLRNNLGFSRVRVAYTAGEAIGPDRSLSTAPSASTSSSFYGSTETAVFVCLQPDNQASADTVGVPDRTGLKSRSPRTAKSWSKSPGLLKEYYKNPQATAEVLTADGWYRTSDAGLSTRTAIPRSSTGSRMLDASRAAQRRCHVCAQLPENKLKFFPQIKEVVAYGDGREKVCVMINIDFDAVGTRPNGATCPTPVTPTWRKNPRSLPTRKEWVFLKRSTPTSAWTRCWRAAR